MYNTLRIIGTLYRNRRDLSRSRMV